jgi:hypothetical protein
LQAKQQFEQAEQMLTDYMATSVQKVLQLALQLNKTTFVVVV